MQNVNLISTEEVSKSKIFQKSNVFKSYENHSIAKLSDEL
jgi:hypothetical protein